MVIRGWVGGGGIRETSVKENKTYSEKINTEDQMQSIVIDNIVDNIVLYTLKLLRDYILNFCTTKGSNHIAIYMYTMYI